MREQIRKIFLRISQISVILPIVKTHLFNEIMTTLQLNAEIYEALSIIAQDESLLKKAARSLKRLASMKKDETLMSQEEFLPR